MRHVAAVVVFVLLFAGLVIAQEGDVQLGMEEAGVVAAEEPPPQPPTTDSTQTPEGVSTPSTDIILAPPVAPAVAQPTVIQRVTRSVRNIWHTRVIKVSEMPDDWKREEANPWARGAVDEHLVGRGQADGTTEMMDAGGPMLREEGAALADRTLTKAGENADVKVKGLMDQLSEHWLAIVLLAAIGYYIFVVAMVVAVMLLAVA